SGAHWQPQHAGERPLFETSSFDPPRGVADSVFDTVTLPTGHPGRRVQLKSVSNRFRVIFSRGGRGRAGPPAGGERMPSPGGDRSPSNSGDRPSPGGNPPNPWIVVHCAAETTRLEQAIAAHKAALDENLKAMERDGQESLAA